jgi:hypothetical protein
LSRVCRFAFLTCTKWYFNASLYNYLPPISTKYIQNIRHFVFGTDFITGYIRCINSQKWIICISHGLCMSHLPVDVCVREMLMVFVEIIYKIKTNTWLESRKNVCNWQSCDIQIIIIYTIRVFKLLRTFIKVYVWL